MRADKSVFCAPEILTPVESGVELPTIDYRRFNGVKYRYFYGLGIGRKGKSKLDIVKVDVETKEQLVWSSHACFPAEPIFVPKPGLSLCGDT